MIDGPVERLMALYPRTFFACHRTHTRDPRTNRRLSQHQVNIIEHLDPVSPVTLNTLAQHLGVTPGTMSVHVEHLVRTGYVLRRRDRLDLRRVQLRLSPSGERIRAAQSVLDPALVADLVSALTPEERDAAFRGLEALARGAAEVLKGRREARRVPKPGVNS
ncbi:hypothetical protein PHYC_01047 [Phycisphaerales bacterium]|nr:hypothetical protein PHYC_01047 [Phycisphaerales bacterium]